MDRREALEKFVPGERRPWALDVLQLPDREIIPLKNNFHDAVIRGIYSNYFEGQQILAASGDYTFKGGNLEISRGFLMNNCAPFSLSDWHAQQLQWQLARINKKIERYAVVGTDASLAQALNVYFLLEDVVIHVFEQNPESIKCAKQLAESLGLGSVFNFHQGDAAAILPEVAEEIGGFDVIDLQLVLQHLRGDSFNKFWEGAVGALKTGGLIKINELMIGTLGLVKTYDSKDSVLAAKKIIESYFFGDNGPKVPSFLNVGWHWPKGHAWGNKERLVGDILACTGEKLILREDFGLSLPEKESFSGDVLRLTGLRYVVASLAAAMAAKANSLKGVQGQEEMAGKFAGLAAWAFKEGRRVDEILTGQEFEKRLFSVNFSEVAGIVLEKAV
ncbi:MAG: class I SAM-dependent methyltransferase [Patescibacteria group bacterium]|nr:class I SAM-dependent methyltransferase [Patescibacteria group bacterium]